jgi:t-SNARE complex subunit (syntaxin)
MRDIGAIVSEQSPIIAGVEQTVIAATDNIIAGNQQLTGAARYQVNSNITSYYKTLILFFRKNIVKNFVGY